MASACSSAEAGSTKDVLYQPERGGGCTACRRGLVRSALRDAFGWLCRSRSAGWRLCRARGFDGPGMVTVMFCCRPMCRRPGGPRPPSARSRRKWSRSTLPEPVRTTKHGNARARRRGCPSPHPSGHGTKSLISQRTYDETRYRALHPCRPVIASADRQPPAPANHRLPQRGRWAAGRPLPHLQEAAKQQHVAGSSVGENGQVRFAARQAAHTRPDQRPPRVRIRCMGPRLRGRRDCGSAHAPGVLLRGRLPAANMRTMLVRPSATSTIEIVRSLFSPAGVSCLGGG